MKFPKLPRLTGKRVFKYGAAATIASAVGAYGAGFISAQPGFRKKNAKELRNTALITGAAATVAVASRKHLGRAAVAGGRMLARSVKKDGAVIFRRIRGRIIAMKR